MIGHIEVSGQLAYSNQVSFFSDNNIAESLLRFLHHVTIGK